MPRRKQQLAPKPHRVLYRNVRWTVVTVRPNWLIVERNGESVWIPKACIPEEDLQKAQAYLTYITAVRQGLA